MGHVEYWAMVLHVAAVVAAFIAGYAFRWLHAEHLRNRP